MPKGKILVVDDNESILSAVEILLLKEFEKISLISDPNLIPSLIENKDFDLVLLDMNFTAGVNTGNEGLYWLSRIKEIQPELEVVLFTAYGNVELAVEALKKGASDFILKPWDNEKLKATLASVYKLRQSKKEIKELRKRQDALKGEVGKDKHIIIAESPQMQDVLKLIDKVAGTDANVLITGENGTGKELIARELHRRSNRSEEIMISVDMGAVVETLFESELFGHKKGSFTDAREDRTGKIESAHRGTLFLDEIGNLPLHLQHKMLSVLQNRAVIPLGGNRHVSVNIRLVCATNRDLNGMVSEGSFRDDLLYRINTIQIEIPPLRERPDDIAAIANHFLIIYKRKYRKTGLKFAKSGLSKLLSYNWPGNVRELQHTIEKAVILTEGAELCSDDFYFRTQSNEMDQMLDGTIDDMEKILIEKVLIKTNSNLTAAAEKLGISRQTLYNKMKKYQL